MALSTPVAASQMPGQGPIGDPPLPVPRPHFPSDDPPPLREPPRPPAPPAAAPAPAVQGPDRDDAATCLGQLKALGAAFETVTMGPPSNPLCIVVEPVRLLSLQVAEGTTVGFPDKPTVACAAGAVFSDFVRALLVPLAKGSYGASVATVSTGPGFDCRTRDHIPGAKISAHGQGLAIDIAQIGLVDGRKLEIGQPKSEADRMFDRAARAGGCGFFHTALGPGADAFHETHWHFDILPRGSHGDSKFCQ